MISFRDAYYFSDYAFSDDIYATYAYAICRHTDTRYFLPLFSPLFAFAYAITLMPADITPPRHAATLLIA